MGTIFELPHWFSYLVKHGAGKSGEYGGHGRLGEEFAGFGVIQ